MACLLCSHLSLTWNLRFPYWSFWLKKILSRTKWILSFLLRLLSHYSRLNSPSSSPHLHLYPLYPFLLSRRSRSLDQRSRGHAKGKHLPKENPSPVLARLPKYKCLSVNMVVKGRRLKSTQPRSQARDRDVRQSFCLVRNPLTSWKMLINTIYSRCLTEVGFYLLGTNEVAEFRLRGALYHRLGNGNVLLVCLPFFVSYG